MRGEKKKLLKKCNASFIFLLAVSVCVVLVLLLQRFGGDNYIEID